MMVSRDQNSIHSGPLSKTAEGLRAWRCSLASFAGARGADVPWNPCGPPPSIKFMSTQLLQFEKIVGDLQKSFDQLRSEVGTATPIFSSTTSSSERLMREGSNIEL